MSPRQQSRSSTDNRYYIADALSRPDLNIRIVTAVAKFGLDGVATMWDLQDAASEIRKVDLRCHPFAADPELKALQREAAKAVTDLTNALWDREPRP